MSENSETTAHPGATKGTEEPDEWLLKKALNGDAESFGMLVQRYERQLFQFALGMLGDHESAFDVVQESLLSAFKSLRKFRGESAFSTWLYAITRNKVLSALRKKARLSTAVVSLNDGGFEIEDRKSNPAGEVDFSEVRERLLEEIQKLPEDYREAILLREVEGCSYVEIARITGWELSTVKTKIRRARLRLRESLSGLL